MKATTVGLMGHPVGHKEPHIWQTPAKLVANSAGSPKGMIPHLPNKAKYSRRTVVVKVMNGE
jgi:hypothetical protein